MRRVLLIVPCFNEARRLPISAFLAHLRENSQDEVWFVDDGSTDETREVIQSHLIPQFPQRIRLLKLERNGGKAVAVRHGLREALKTPCRYLGYWDADLSTPLEELGPMVSLLESTPTWDVVLGARVRLLGRTIQRNPLRHALGRLFATLASEILRLPVYDTQCGAKLLRRQSPIEQILEEPFRTRWVFDMELLGRYCKAALAAGRATPASGCVEHPLQHWEDVKGSKVRLSHLPRVLLDLLLLRRHIRNWTPPRAATLATPERKAS